MDADREQDIARLEQLPERLPLYPNEGVGRRLDIGETHRSSGGVVDASCIGQRMIERVACLKRPVEARDRLRDLQLVEHPINQPGIARARPETRHRLMYPRHLLAEFFGEPP